VLYQKAGDRNECKEVDLFKVDPEENRDFLFHHHRGFSGLSVLRNLIGHNGLQLKEER
jgi:hypothetical protein